ncbi:MAG: ABC transporter permease [Burkholderiales bacterium]|nr:ABC transporter permease [Burkholderiales bacterium]
MLLRRSWIVYLKELADALRDRRTLAIVLLSSVAIGPLVLMLVSTLAAGNEKRAEARVVLADGIERAPTLRNYIERQTYTVRPPPAGYEQQLREGSLGDPVLVVPPNFEADLVGAKAPRLRLVSASGNRRAQGGLGAVEGLLSGFNREQATLRLALRGVAPALVEAVRVENFDLADPAARAAQLATMVPFFVLMAVLYGATGAALDTTAGERERGSLEPLLMNPVPRLALALGKWGAVASVAMLIALLSCLSFLPGQWLLRSETLAAMFRYGAADAAVFVVLLTPLAGMLAALLMAIAIRCKSAKEAQANVAVVLLAFSMLPMVSLMDPEGDKPWHYWVPGLAQTTLMGRVVKGEALSWVAVLPSFVTGTVVVVLALAYVVRTLRQAALK